MILLRAVQHSLSSASLAIKSWTQFSAECAPPWLQSVRTSLTTAMEAFSLSQDVSGCSYEHIAFIFVVFKVSKAMNQKSANSSLYNDLFLTYQQ